MNTSEEYKQLSIKEFTRAAQNYDSSGCMILSYHSNSVL